jgi:hypothetical protein
MEEACLHRSREAAERQQRRACRTIAIPSTLGA